MMATGGGDDDGFEGNPMMAMGGGDDDGFEGNPMMAMMGGMDDGEEGFSNPYLDGLGSDSGSGSDGGGSNGGEGAAAEPGKKGSAIDLLNELMFDAPMQPPPEPEPEPEPEPVVVKKPKKRKNKKKNPIELMKALRMKENAKEAADKEAAAEAEARAAEEALDPTDTGVFGATKRASKVTEYIRQKQLERDRDAPTQAAKNPNLGAAPSTDPALEVYKSAEETGVFPLSHLAVPKDELPGGVNPRKREEYLSDDDFALIFKGMDRQSFSSMPKWRRDKLKRDSMLF